MTTEIAMRFTAGPAPDPAMRYIQRAADKQCWHVGIKRGGRHLAKRFFDSTHCGFDGSLAAAKAWRDKTLAEVPAPSILERRQLKRCDNSSGTPGVCLTKKRYGKLYWTVETVMGNRRMTRSFSVHRYGDEGAFERAIEERRLHLKMLVENENNERSSMRGATCLDPFDRDARGCESSLAGPFMPG